MTMSETRRKAGVFTYAHPLDHGQTRYVVTIEFSNDYRDADALGTDHPSMWGWVDLIGEPDARVLSWSEEPNPGYGVAEALRDLLAAGLIEHTGEYRDGRPVYVATEAGMKAGSDE